MCHCDFIYLIFLFFFCSLRKLQHYIILIFIDIEETVAKLIQRVQELTAENCEGRIELHLVGGYSDEKFYSEKIFYSIMSAFHSHSLEIHVTLACVGDLNTIVRNGMPWPITYGTGIELKTGLSIFKAVRFDIETLTCQYTKVPTCQCIGCFEKSVHKNEIYLIFRDKQFLFINIVFLLGLFTLFKVFCIILFCIIELDQAFVSAITFLI